MINIKKLILKSKNIYDELKINTTNKDNKNSKYYYKNLLSIPDSQDNLNSQQSINIKDINLDPKENIQKIELSKEADIYFKQQELNWDDYTKDDYFKVIKKVEKFSNINKKQE